MNTNGSSSSIPLPRNESLGATSSIHASSLSPSMGMGNGSRDDLNAKTPAEQLDYWIKQLETLRKIEAGAEHMLDQQGNNVPRTLREEIQLELNNTRRQIDDVQKNIDRLRPRAAPRKKSDTPPVRRRPSATNDELDDRDSIQTVIQNTSVLVQALHHLGHPGSSSGLRTAASTPNLTASSNGSQQDRARMEHTLKLTNALQRHVRLKYEMDMDELIRSALPGLADYASKDCRATTYRLLRHTLVDTDSVDRLRKQNVDWYLIKSLARDNKHAIEKEQALKLIRTLVELATANRAKSNSGTFASVPISEAVMRAIIAIAETPEDTFKTLCVQTLTEILLIDIELMARSGGIRTLLHILADGSPDLAPMLTSAFLVVLDSPRTRQYLAPGDEFEIVLSGITDAFGKGPEHAEKMRACTRLVTSILRTWSGLLYFCMQNMSGIRSVIDVLRIPTLDTREIILDFFFDLLNIKTPKWYQTFIDGRRLTMYRRSQQISDHEPASQRSLDTLKMKDQYTALLLLVFTRAGLLDALTCMLEETTNGTNLSRKAVLLMGEVMHLSNHLLPLHMAAQIQAAGRVFQLASDQDSASHRIVGTNILSSLDSFNRHRTRLAPPSGKTIRLRANSLEDPVRRGQRQVEQVRIKIGMQMDERAFQASLLETSVMITKDHTKWNLDVLQDIVEGPLLNQKRMEEAIKVTKFMRKLMSFFHPFNHRYSDIPRRGNVRWVKFGVALINTLLSSPEGQKYLLNEDPLVKDIVRGFAQLDPHNPTLPEDPLFSKKRVEETLSYSYIELLGTLSRTKEGIEILEKYKVFTAFYHLTELRDRQDLVFLIISALDYSIDGHPRIVLSKALTCFSPPVRIFATNHLGMLIRRSTTPVPWMLRLLITQMYDADMNVCILAVRFLEEACEDIEMLQMVVGMQPTFQHLGETAHPLLLKAMSTPIGFRYLHDAGYIDREIENWFHERNAAYVVKMEIFLDKAFGFPTGDRESDPASFEEMMPSHFYGEMTKTELGCAVLAEKGHFNEFATFIRECWKETNDSELVLKLKSFLWAVGNIGAAEGGLPFLEDEELIPDLILVAQESPILSVRGTAFFVLGLISSTIPGAEVLSDHGWDATLTPLGLPTGICVPADLTKFIGLERWQIRNFPRTDRLLPTTDEHENEFMTAIYNLSNTVVANTASRSLARMKSRPEYRAAFSSPAVLYRTLHTISTAKYKQPVRRYILDLSTLPLDPEIVTQVAAAAQRLREPEPESANDAQGNQVPRSLNHRTFSIVRPKPQRRRVDATDEGDSSEDELAPPPPVPPRNVALRPMSRIIGFAH